MLERTVGGGTASDRCAVGQDVAEATATTRQQCEASQRTATQAERSGDKAGHDGRTGDLRRGGESNQGCRDDYDKVDTRVTAPTEHGALRIVVRCLSHNIPGPRAKRTATMANIICQHHLRRDSDPDKDKITSMGLQDLDGKKVRFLFESGSLQDDNRLEDVPVLGFKWTGSDL